MKARTLTVWMTGLLLSASFTSNAQNVPVATGRYTPDWDNLAQWECPEWFQNVKFGIWAHWDPQSQGADGDWYGRGMYFKGGGNYNSGMTSGPLEHGLYGSPSVLQGFV